MTFSVFMFSTLALAAAAILAVGGRRRLARRFRRPRILHASVLGLAGILGPLEAYCAVAGYGSPERAIDVFAASVQVATVGGFAGVGTLISRDWIPVSPAAAKRRVLAIGAHPDDLELGCGATLAKLADAGHEIHALVMTAGERGGDSGSRPAEALRGARFLGVRAVEVLELGDTRLREHELEMVGAIEAAIERQQPDLVLTHSLNDQHQDHLAVHMATLRAARFHSTILCYESPSATQAFQPSVFIDIDGYLEVKAMAVAAHRDQRGKPYMTPERVRGLAIYRGGQAKVRHAEGYEPVRVLGNGVFEL
jgi:LmbE family N-acetylglucosaminyl deacetylase